MNFLLFLILALAQLYLMMIDVSLQDVEKERGLFLEIKKVEKVLVKKLGLAMLKEVL